MTDQFTLDGVQGQLVVRRWPREDARYVAVIAHGYGEHGGRYAHVAARLVADGATVVAPDHLGHGRSEGERALVADIEDVVTDLKSVVDQVRVDGLPLVLIGHSLGGMIAARYAQRHGTDLAALVLSGPVVGGNPALEALAGMDPIPDIPIDPAVLSRDPATGAAYAADDLVWHGPFKRPTLLAITAAVTAIASGPDLGALPTLWIHGEQDQLAPYAITRTAMTKLRGEHLTERVYAGAQHEIFNETNKDEVIDDVIGFLAKVV